MKSFFKKLSLVLVLAMVVTIVPMNTAKAAEEIAVSVGASKDAIFTEKTLEIGEKITGIKFYGPKGYYKAGDVVTWSSSDETVAVAAADDTEGAKVYDGKVTAVAAGTATITVTTDRGAVGSFTVTVPAAAVVEPEVEEPVVEEPVAPITQYMANTIKVQFATAEEAAAAKKDVVVKRVRKTTRGTTKYTAFSTTASIDEKDDTVLLVKGSYAKGCDYQVSATGLEATVFTATWGSPAYAEIEYSKAEMTGDSRIQTITGAADKTFGTANPTITVYDDNDVIVAIIKGATNYFIANNYTDIKATYTKTNGSMYASLLGAGAVQFRKIEGQSMTIATKVEWKATAASQYVAIPEQADAITVYPVEYKDPDLGGYAWDMVLVASDTAVDKIVWHTEAFLEENDVITGSMKVGDTAKLAAYFLGTDDKKYVANAAWFKEQKVSSTKIFTEMSATYARFAYVVSDDSPKNVVSVSADGRTVRALNDGTASVILWQLEDGKVSYDSANNNIPVGEIVITVAAKPYVDQIVLLDNNVFGYYNALDKTKKVEYYLIDQNGDRIAEPEAATLQQLATDNAKVTVTKRATATVNGELTINMAGMAVTTNAVEVKLTCGKAAKTTLLFNVNKVNEDAATAGVSYAVKATNVTINTKTITGDPSDATVAAKKNAKIEVVKLHDGVEMAPVSFAVTADTTADAGDKHAAGVTYFVTIQAPDGSIVSKDLSGAAFATVTKDTAGAVTAVSDTTAATSFTLDCYAVAGVSEQKHMAAGTYVVSLYEKQLTNGVNYIVPTGAQTTFEVSYGVNEITNVQNKTVKADKKGVTTSAAWTTTTATKTKATTVVSGNTVEDIDPISKENKAWTTFAKEIVATLACSYDEDSDATTGNYKTIAEVGTVEAVDYTVGANGEIYIISFTVKYYIPGMTSGSASVYRHTQTIDLGLLFQTGGLVD